MTDTPEHIKAIQLKIWLSKPPMERIRQMITDNDALYKFWGNAHIIKDSTPINENIKEPDKNEHNF